MEQESGLERLTKKYGTVTAAQRTDVRTAFDKAATQRIGSMPEFKSLSTSDVAAQLAGVKMDLADLAESYGQLGLDFNSLVGKDAYYGVSDALLIKLYKITGKREKEKEVRKAAIGRHGKAIEILVDKMATVIDQQYEKAVQGRDLSQRLQVENLNLMRSLDEKLIRSLKQGTYTGADMAAAELEVKRITTEFQEIDQVLGEYEGKIQSARASGDLNAVQKLSDEVGQVLDMKYQVMEGRMAAEGVSSEIRRQILDAAEGVQSSKAAIAASRVNYQTIATLIDSMNELEIKYRHARETMIPVFKIQGQTAQIGASAMDIKQTLADVAQISTRLLEVNKNLVIKLADETFALLKNPLYDVSKAREIEERISEYRTQLNQAKLQWAENQQRLDSLTEPVQYVTHK